MLSPIKLRLRPPNVFPVGKKTYGRPFAPSSLCFVTGRDDVFVAGGNNAVQVWTFDSDSRKLHSDYFGLGKLKRNIVNMMVRAHSGTRDWGPGQLRSLA